jgi:hypothetical protein
LIGRFSTTAKLDLFKKEDTSRETLFRWYEFKFGDKRGGELLALFELIEVNPVRMKDLLFLKSIFNLKKETQIAESIYELTELAVTPLNFPPQNYVTKTLKNPIYDIPESILPPSRPYDIEV